MKEIDELRKGLKNSSIMLLKEHRHALECSFVKEGIVNHIVHVEDDILAEALRQKITSGIAEGVHFNAFRHEFESFALHVKARKLYADLAFSLPMYLPVLDAKEEAYEQTVNAAVA
ncbi:hypothetical protein [Botryobacter ruber]|uniref:hypothetical protein n=1 Tax=Botryobacter ruber TaxID=2171629 RepID=UPI000E0B83E3|nr:hypothetical protein [Botryobacter ruber]